jgi:mannosyl-oligosaccharide alpha-1,2-mannosidase
LILAVFLPEDSKRLAKIRSAFSDAWNGYKKCAFGRDFLRPISCKGSDWLNASLTLVDSLDTLWIFGLYDEFDLAAQYVEANFSYSATGSVFEMVIRVIGGLMSAYQLSGRASLLVVAEKFATELLVAFDTPTKLPMPNIDLANARPSTWGWAPRSTFLAHVGSVGPELMTLAAHSQNHQILNASDQIMNFFFTRDNFHGLWPLRIDFSTGLFADNDLSFDAYGDSFYEYLLKLFIMTDGQCVKCGELYVSAIDGMKTYLLRSSRNQTYVGTIKANIPEDKLSYVSFFIPGMIALGSQYFNKSDLDLAIALAKTGADWHNATKTNLMADSYEVQQGVIKILDPSFKLRPEFIESCFYLWRLTGNETWRNIGWQIFKSMILNCRATYGFGALKNINYPELGLSDCQDSYLLAETFKYAFLLFSNSSVMPLDEFVFTTEGHPLKHFDKDWIARHYTGKFGYVIT